MQQGYAKGMLVTAVGIPHRVERRLRDGSVRVETQYYLVAPPKRVTRPDGAVLPFARELDLALQPTQGQLRTAIETVAKAQ